MGDIPAPISQDLIDTVRNFGLRLRDIMDLVGCGRVRAQRILAAAGGLTLPGSGYREVPVDNPRHASDRTVAVVPSGDVARHTILWGERTDTRISFYLRFRALNQPVRFAATDLGTDVDGLVYAYKILARAIIAAGSVRPHFADPDVDAAAAEFWDSNASFLEDHWNGATDVLALDAEYSNVEVPLGYAGRGGIAGVRHVNLAELRDADTFKDVSSI
jgi:hypothetical protein